MGNAPGDCPDLQDESCSATIGEADVQTLRIKRALSRSGL